MAESSQPSKPQGFALAAKRVAGWTSNLLVSAALLVAALTVGRQLTYWWAEPQAATGARSSRLLETPALGHAEDLQRLGFGAAPFAFGRRVLVGDKAAVFAGLRQDCRAAAVQARQAQRQPGPREFTLLRRTAELTPVEEEPGQWRMFELDGPLPLVVVTAADQTSPASQVADSGPRVLCWGLAFPRSAETESWTLFSCAPRDSAASSAAEGPELPMPLGAQRGLSLQTVAGGAIVSVVGPGRYLDWQAYFDRWFADRGWTATAEWQKQGTTRCRRFEREQPGWSVLVALQDSSPVRAVLTVAPK